MKGFKISPFVPDCTKIYPKKRSGPQFIIGGTGFYHKICGEEGTVLFITSEQFQKCHTANQEMIYM